MIFDLTLGYSPKFWFVGDDHPTEKEYKKKIKRLNVKLVVHSELFSNGNMYSEWLGSLISSCSSTDVHNYVFQKIRKQTW